MAGVAFAVEGDGVGFATESYAASALYTTLASLSGALWRIRRAKIRLDGAAFAADFCLNSNARSHNRAQHVADGLDAFGHIEHLGLERLAPCEGEQLTGQPRGPIHGIGDRVHVAAASLLREIGAPQE